MCIIMCLIWGCGDAAAVEEFGEKDSPKLVVPVSQLDVLYTDIPKLKIKVENNEWVKVYIREATYDVSLVNRYDES